MRHDLTPHAGEVFRTRRPRRLQPLQRGRVWGGLGAGPATLPSDRTPERHHLITLTQGSAHATTTSTFLGERLMSTAHGNTVRRLQQQEEAAQAALAAQRAKVRATQAKLRHAAQQERLAHQQVMGRLADEAGLATLDLNTLRQAFAVLGQLAQCPHALAQWVAEKPLPAPHTSVAEGDGVRTAQEAGDGAAPMDREKQSSLPSFPCGKR
jgi:hypothetical protein